MKANLPRREPEIADFWKKINVYKKMLELKGPNKFVLHDGPPYANGVIHIGHALNKILKDVVVKYKAMRNYSTPYVPGWDCHGLPIEYQLFKDLKTDKRKMNRVEFRKKAREFASKFIEIQKSEFIRLGVLGEWENPYLTMSASYESVIIRIFGGLASAGYIYRAKKPIYWCAHCETALADAEVEYAESISPYIYVKFKLTKQPEELKRFKGENLFVLIWTTTPWTLPANVALAFNPDFEYAVVEVSSGEKYIIADKLVEKVVNEAGIKKYKILRKIKGAKLEGIECENPLVARKSTGVTGSFVNMEEGTGVVHIAPGHGVEDYLVGLKYNLEVISPVDERGVFTSEVPDFAGHRVFAANSLIVKKLKEKGLLLFDKEFSHSYPHCWRCKHEIIFRATDQWFLNVEHNNLRKHLIESTQTVKWIPDYGINRITGMLQTRPDWCLSRQRYWGVPIPVIYCNSCGKAILSKDIIECFAKITLKETSDAWFIRPVEDFLPEKFSCSCGGKNFKKEEDILDVWFDSGVSSEAVLRGDGGRKGENWPADMYLEGSDQHRGWFQTSLIPAVALRKNPPYKSVLTHGFVVDGEGKKMSKSLGNVVAPQEIMQLYGAEILRLWACSADYVEDVRISKEIIGRLIETYRKIRNTIRFLTGNLYDFNPLTMCLNKDDLLSIDLWMLYRLQVLIKEVTDAYEEYKFHTVIYLINNFCVSELSGFYLDILKDRLYTFALSSKERRSAQTVLYELLIAVVKLSAPVLSFTCEEAWQVFKKENSGASLLADSIFLENIPQVNEDLIDEELDGDWRALVQIRDRVNLEIETLRKQGVIGSSLEAKVILALNSEEQKSILRKYSSQLPSVFIVSQVEIKETSEKEITVLHAEGTRCDRCWNWSKSTDERGLCSRCRQAIEDRG
ncbi:MAG: isoleucine--tRNA ligase [Elusimicrobiota bacterium]